MIRVAVPFSSALHLCRLGRSYMLFIVYVYEEVDNFSNNYAWTVASVASNYCCTVVASHDLIWRCNAAVTAGCCIPSFTHVWRGGRRRTTLANWGVTVREEKNVECVFVCVCVFFFLFLRLSLLSRTMTLSCRCTMPLSCRCTMSLELFARAQCH